MELLYLLSMRKLKGFTVLLEIEVEGAKQVKDKYPNSLSIFLLPPDKAELERRIRNRGTEKEEAIKKDSPGLIMRLKHQINLIFHNKS